MARSINYGPNRIFVAYKALSSDSLSATGFCDTNVSMDGGLSWSVEESAEQKRDAFMSVNQNSVEVPGATRAEDALASDEAKQL